ncbi:MAG TPA: lytic transglycosylase [Parvularcula sp.]|nr:lytic transglycosylase [Parvularcula sp.]HBS34012.1 lytic transglycosylase [Parvularcula sp.]
MTDAVTAASAATKVSGALKKASASTGVGFDYLYRVAVRESSLNPAAKARTSSAAGLFQFIEQTWLGAVKKYGAGHGLGAEAADIVRGPGGRYTVADPARRQAILDLRFDAEKAAGLAAELARENKASLEGALGRAVGAAELYAAHFLGPTGARTLLSADAGASAAALLPSAAAANRHVFFDGARERSVGEVIDSFRKTIGGAAAAVEEIKSAIGDGLSAIAGDAFRETAAFLPAQPLPGLETRSLSPLVLAVLQALDWRGPGFSDGRD